MFFRAVLMEYIRLDALLSFASNVRGLVHRERMVQGALVFGDVGAGTPKPLNFKPRALQLLHSKP